MYKKILLATDGSKNANKAAKHAIRIAGLSGAELIALNVMDTSSLIGLSPPEELIVENFVIQLKETLEEEGHKALEEISKLVEESRTEDEHQEEIKLTMVIEEGSPADIIVKKIKEENIDLVVMGTLGKSGIAKFLLGSVAEKVVRSSSCPVLVIP